MLGIRNDYVREFPISKMLMLPLRIGFHFLCTPSEKMCLKP